MPDDGSAIASASPATTTVVNNPSPLAAKPDDDLISAYVKLRDHVDERKKAHTAELARYREAMGKIEMEFLRRFIDRGANSTKTDAGTAYVSDETSVTVHAWSECFRFIEGGSHWEFLEARVSKTAVLEYMAQHGQEVPGVKVRRENRVNIRRS